MLNKTFILTSIFAAMFMTLSLSFMQLFDFIKWSPVGWTKTWNLFSTAHFSVKWAVLFLALVVIFAILYVATSYLDSIPPGVSAIFLGVVGVIAIEWMISEPKSLLDLAKSVSIPFLAITAIVLRFMTGTSVFMRKLSRKVRN